MLTVLWLVAVLLVVLALAYPVVIVRARLLSLGRSFEEAAMDLGASPVRTLGRVTLPLLWPSVFVLGVFGCRWVSCTSSVMLTVFACPLCVRAHSLPLLHALLSSFAACGVV